MCINKNLAYGMCSIYCSYIKLSLSAGENANSLMLQCNSNCVCNFRIYFKKNAVHVPFSEHQYSNGSNRYQGSWILTINAKSGTLYEPY